MKIKTATAHYTGGGIYIYYGQLENGLYFRTDDDSEYISICNADTGQDDADYIEFYEQHEINSYTGQDAIEFFNCMLSWIIQNEPTGNYLKSELEKRYQ